MSGIYFLFKNNRMVYIGQSINVQKRISSHTKDFDAFRVIPCAVPDLLKYEKRLINYFKPELNGETGGARKGAGRPKTKEDTVVMRVPKSLVPAVKKLIKKKSG